MLRTVGALSKDEAADLQRPAYLFERVRSPDVDNS